MPKYHKLHEDLAYKATMTVGQIPKLVGIRSRELLARGCDLPITILHRKTRYGETYLLFVLFL